MTPPPPRALLKDRIEQARRALRLPESVSLHDLQRAYRRECRASHPDGLPPEARGEAEARMKVVNEAYATLKDFIQRTPVSLRAEDLERAAFDPDQWWREHFGQAPRRG